MVKKTKLAENLYIYSQTNEEELLSNSYLLLGNQNILIDASFLIKRPKIDIVVLTHCHEDHSKFSREYQKLGAKIMIGKQDAEHLVKADEIRSPKWARTRFGNSIKKCKPNFKLKEGSIVKNNNFFLKIIETPGHTPGGIALYEPKKKILFSGDTWFGGAMIGTWRHKGGSLRKLKKSLKKLEKLDTEILCPGHDIVFKRKRWGTYK